MHFWPGSQIVAVISSFAPSKIGSSSTTKLGSERWHGPLNPRFVGRCRSRRGLKSAPQRRTPSGQAIPDREPEHRCAGRRATLRSEAGNAGSPTIQVNVIHVFEKRPPAGETAVEWFLLTTLLLGRQPTDKEKQSL